jgi:DNA-binding PadR family transcriptional regulator
VEATIDTLTNTELAILGLVAERPKHGYQIEQDIAGRGMREWTEIGFSSIYYVLNKLEAAGWLESQPGGAEDADEAAAGGPAAEAETTSPGRRAGPARKVYHLTAAGWAGYRAGVRERLANPRPRSGDFDLALSNLPALAPEEARAALETCLSRLRERLEHVRAKWAQDRAAAAQEHYPFPPHVDALFDHSIAGLEAEIAWLEKFFEGIHNGNPQLEK